MPSHEYKTALSRLFEQGGFPIDAFYIDKAFQDRKLIVYGAGESFHYFKEVVMRQYGYIPSAILDRKFQSGDTFEGIPAFSPLEYKPSSEEKENGLVVVCLGKQAYFDEIINSLKIMGFYHIISLMDIYEIHNPFRLPQGLEERGFQYYLEQKKRIESCLDILADDESREIYIRVMQTHLQRRPVGIPMRERHEQYTPRDVRLLRGYSRFIYCGVSIGEMASVFNRIGKVEELVCFEPDPNQFSLLTQYFSKHYEMLARRVTAIPCALYSDDGIRPFTYSDTSFGSRILGSGKTWIQTATIDHVLPGFSPTFICMDIEGAEFEALKGAEMTIRGSCPDMGISVYHSPCHLWEIPLYLDALGLGYRFYLRNYTSFTGETVLYATV